MEVELRLTKKELEYLYFAVQNYTLLGGIENLPVEEQFELYQSTKNKLEHEFIADHIFDLLENIECLEGEDGILYDEWCDKLWCETGNEIDGYMVKRTPEMWTWDSVGKLQALVEQLEAHK